MQLSASQGIGTCKEPIASSASQEAKIVIDARLRFLASNSTHKKQDLFQQITPATMDSIGRMTHSE